ncbi:MAG: UDP-glucuronic acid decarboxylase family protein [Candidatus Omnitrophota bacterium]
MRILLTGGAGFIGSHLCKKFIKTGATVTCVDNFITGSRDNISELIGSPKFKLVEHDISQPLYVTEDIDWVLHFASLASPKYYLTYPIKTLKSGLLGTHNCLGIAMAKGAKFLLASTSEVYGDPHVHPQIEEYWGNVSSTGVRSCYDESKRGAEALTYAYMRKHNLDIRVVRIFNTYGPNMQIDDGRVVSNFIIQALRSQALTVYGDGSQTRSFCYIDDLVQGIMTMMKIDYSKPLNLGNPSEFTMINLAELVIEMAKSSSKIQFSPLPQDDPKMRCPDITKAIKQLSWQPKFKLEDGLKKTIDYFRGKINPHQLI